MFTRISVGLTVLGLAMLSGCAPAPTATVSEPAPPDAAGVRYLLKEEPAGARGAIEVRQHAKDGDEVVIVGRIGGQDDPWYERQVGFTIVDPAIKSCLDTGDGCPTPWDYCCTPKEELTQGMVTVKFVDDNGQVVAGDARKLLGLRELNTVVVMGKYRHEGDSHIVLARALHVRPEKK